MRIYSDTDLNVFYIEGVDSGPVSDFSATFSGDTISIQRISSQVFEVSGLMYSQVQDVSGSSFASAQLAHDYIVSLLKPNFPLRFTAQYPLQVVSGNVLTIDTEYFFDGGNF